MSGVTGSDSEMWESKTFLDTLTDPPKLPTPSIQRWSPPTGRIWQYERSSQSRPLVSTVGIERGDRILIYYIFQPFLSPYERPELLNVPFGGTHEFVFLNQDFSTPGLTFYPVLTDAASHTKKGNFTGVFVIYYELNRKCLIMGGFQDKVSIWLGM